MAWNEGSIRKCGNDCPADTTSNCPGHAWSSTKCGEFKPQPSIELSGTITGTLETPIDLSSGLKTTVTEKLLKELDRRSTWLNADRNLLRITHRGMEAVNIAGSFKGKVTLRIPPSITPVSYI